MIAAAQLVVFRVNENRYAFPLDAVERIVRAAEVTPLPKAPGIVLGVIDIEGRVRPVLNLRKRLGLPERPLEPSQQFLLAQTSRRELVLVIDEVLEVADLPPAGLVPAETLRIGVQQIHGLVQLPDGLVLMQDLEKFLALDEEWALDAALGEEAAHARR